jgi:hypothetical protein
MLLIIYTLACDRVAGLAGCSPCVCLPACCVCPSTPQLPTHLPLFSLLQSHTAAVLMHCKAFIASLVFLHGDCAQTAVFLGGCFAFEGLLVHLLSSINTLRSIQVARSVILIHVGVLLMCFMFGLIWHRAVTKVRMCTVPYRHLCVRKCSFS